MINILRVTLLTETIIAVKTGVCIGLKTDHKEARYSTPHVREDLPPFTYSPQTVSKNSTAVRDYPS